MDEKTPQEKFSGLKFSEMRNCDILDVNNKKIGRLQDAIFKRSEAGMELTKFLVGGSFMEELLEDLGLKPDIDPVFKVDKIASVAPKSIKLNCAGSELKSTTTDDDAIEEDEVKLSKLSSVKLIDNENEEIGNIIDMKFSGGSFQFVVGDGVFKEMLEDLGLREDIDFLISPSHITNFSQKELKLDLNKNDLNIMFKRSIRPEYRKTGELARAKMKSHGVNAYYPMR